MTRLFNTSAIVEINDLPPLNRAKWHNPLVSIIVTHHNYSDHVRDALLSVLDQSYENWECVVVDDASEPEHQIAVERIVNAIGSHKIRLVKLPENVGQIPAAFAGLDATSGEFVCILDPDDRYAEMFVEAALVGHLNEVVYCPILSTDQRFMANGAVITGTAFDRKTHFLEEEGNVSVVPEKVCNRLFYFPSSQSGWHAVSTSSMMFRRSALEYMRPHKVLSYKGSADAYLASGAHQIGGSLFLTKPLVYRMIHANNAYLHDRIIALGQFKGHPSYRDRSVGLLRRQDVIEAIKANGGGVLLYQHLPKPYDEPESALGRAWRRILFRDPRFIAKWKNSIAKWRYKDHSNDRPAI